MPRVNLTKLRQVTLTEEEKNRARETSRALFGRPGMAGLVRSELERAWQSMRRYQAAHADVHQVELEDLVKMKLPKRLRRHLVSRSVERKATLDIPFEPEKWQQAEDLLTYTGMSFSALVRLLLEKAARELEPPAPAPAPAQAELRLEPPPQLALPLKGSGE